MLGDPEAGCDLGMSISAHGVNRSPRMRKRIARSLGSPIVGIPTLTADRILCFESLNGLVKEFDIRVAIHMDEKVCKAVDVLTAIDKYDERIGACADLGHYIRSGREQLR